jgi:hypothetical protein
MKGKTSLFFIFQFILPETQNFKIKIKKKNKKRKKEKIKKIIKK